MPLLLEFVDSISTAPNVRMSLNNPHRGLIRLANSGLDLSPAPVRRAVSSSMLADGDLIAASSWANRTLKIPIQMVTANADEAARQIQRLGRELARDRNILRVQLGTQDYFFRTYAAPDFAWQMTKLQQENSVVLLEIPAEPFAYGARETLPAQVVNNDPAAGSNGMFFDLTGLKGDVETPLYLQMPSAVGSLGTSVVSAIAVDRRPNKTGIPFVLQCESMTAALADTTIQADVVMSGAGNNHYRTSFASFTTLSTRLSIGAYPAAAAVGTRGTYRVLLRCRIRTPSDAIRVQLDSGTSGVTAQNDPVSITGGNNQPRWVDLGLWTWPIGADPVEDGLSGTPVSVAGQTLNLNVARDSGSGSFDMDCLLFVPADDHYGAISWPVNGATPSGYIVDSLLTRAYPIDGSAAMVNNNPIAIVGTLPMVTPGTEITNRIVFIRLLGITTPLLLAGDDKTSTWSIVPYYWPRYLLSRPVGS